MYMWILEKVPTLSEMEQGSFRFIDVEYESNNSERFLEIAVKLQYLSKHIT